MYQKLEARLHDLFWEAQGEAGELPLIERFLKQYPGTALELGCGSGRLLLALLEKGFLIEGLDNSAEMLTLCRNDKGDCDAVLHHASIEDFELKTLYDAIIIPAFTLQLLDPENMATTLSNIRRHLRPGGGLYLTTFIPWAEIIGELEPGSWFLDQETKMADGNTARCYTRFEIKRFAQLLMREHRYEIVSGDAQIVETSESAQRLSWYWPREMTMLLYDAGFSTPEIICDFMPGVPCHDDSQMLTFIVECDSDEAAPA